MKILKELRLVNKLTQDGLAEKLRIKNNTISQYEAGSFPSFKVIQDIGLFFQTSLDYLILGNNCKYPRNFSFIKFITELKKNNNDKILSNITMSIDALIKNKRKKSINICLDNISENLDNNFHANLKILRKLENMKQLDIAKKLNIARPVVSMYEVKSFPSVDKMIKLSEIFNCSIHAMVTGEKLSFDFKDKEFGQSILMSDHLLSLEDKNFLIKLMNNLLNQK